ncbi:MAG: glycoside hydrolase family 99-like domain-containing protein [Planctomycetaceae bacterium]
MSSRRSPDLRPYFDAAWYVATYGAGRRLLRWRPWAYYRRRGWRKGHSPRRLFDAPWYLERHPDVAASKTDPLAHYVEHGWREGRAPHPVFDVGWYLSRNPDVAAAGTEPLLHWLSRGWREGRSPHPAFDAPRYLAEHPDVAASGVDPLTHYLTIGWKEGRRPHPLFDVGWYLERNPDVALAGIEPLGHFLACGWRERRQTVRGFSAAGYLARRPRPLDPGTNPFVHFLLSEHEPRAGDPAAVAAALAACHEPAAASPASAPAAFPAPSPVPADRTDAGPSNRGDVRAIAIYLPQFHRVPENDRWWGEGFTEWTNVRRGRPMFAGHHQPHVPHPDVGYYDLDDADVLPRQAEMARRHGIHGFCFYHYWFDGRRILEKPVERLLASGRPDFPFCLCWANENWTRAWDGLDREVLLEQRHSPEGDERFLRDILPALRDPRYIRVEGMPLLAVYRPGSLADASATADRWRRLAEREGLPGLHLAAFHSFDRNDPRSFGFDSAIQFPPLQVPTSNLARGGLPGLVPAFRGGVLDYRAAMCHSLARPAPDYPLYRGVMPSWDNTARRLERATVWTNSSPELYGRWLRATVDQMQREQPPERQLLFINAWNEWAEGAHLEPDERHGYRFLEETAAALLPRAAAPAAPAAEGAGAAPSPAAAPRPSAPERHPEVRHARRERLRALLGSPLPEATHGFLLDHGALLAGLAAAGHTLALEEGRPVCRIGAETLPLDDRAGLSAAHARARGDSDPVPFCFVVLQYNKPEVTARCVESLRRIDAAGRRVHVIVVDNGSEPAAVARSRALFDGADDVTLLCTGENLGFARGNNAGYRLARERFGAAFIAVINNDTVVGDPDFVTRCVGLFASHAYSVLGPDIVTPDGRHENPWADAIPDAAGWETLAALFTSQRAAWQATGRAEFRRTGTRTPEAAELHDPVLQGAAFVFSPVFTADRAAAFDERTFLYGEEFLLAVDCLLAGHPLLYSQAVSIAHEEGVSTAAVPEKRKIELGYGAVIETAGWCAERLARHGAALRGEPLPVDAPGIATLTRDGRTHVLLDLFFCQPGCHGGGEYGKAVFRAVVSAAARRGDVQVWAALDPGQFIDDWVHEACRRHAVNTVAVRSYDDIVRLVDGGHFDTFFAPAIVVYTGYEYMRRVGGALRFRPGRTAVVGTLLDVRDLELAEDWERIARARAVAGCTREARLTPRRWTAEKARVERHAEELRGMYRAICSSPALTELVTISEYSAAGIRSRTGTPRPVHVLFAPEKDRAAPEAFAVPGLDPSAEPFALVLNAGREEKNAAGVVAAFERLFADPDFAHAHPGLKVALVGISGLADLGIAPSAHAERFVPLPHLPAGRLEYLLARARFLAYASFNEGFGYPPLEALHHGTPSLVAGNTSVPEVCGRAAVICDPFDLGSIAAGIRTVLKHPPDAASMRAQVATVASRQARDMETLAGLICRPAPARTAASATRAA